MNTYWRKQTTDKPLFPDAEWSKPERADQAGRLGIIGGNKLGFVGAANAYSVALAAGAGEVRSLLPDALKKTVPRTITDTIFAPSNPSGSLARQALDEMRALGDWADGILMIGDAGRNSETALAYTDFINSYTKQLTVTRDAVDLVKNTPDLLVGRPETLMVVSFGQLQKLFQSLYYPVILTFNMQLLPLVEALHKFTTTHPVGIVTLHKDTIVFAQDGEVTSQSWADAMLIWRGDVATKAACYWLWDQKKQLTAVTASWLK